MRSPTFAAVELGTDNGSALVMPHAKAVVMQKFLDRFAGTIGENEHIVMVLDRAGWHGSSALRIPA